MPDHREALYSTESHAAATAYLAANVWSRLQASQLPTGSRPLTDDHAPIERFLAALMHRVLTREFCAQADDTVSVHGECPTDILALLSGEEVPSETAKRLHAWLTIDGEIVYASLRDPFSLFLLWDCVCHFQGNLHPLLTLRVVSLYQRCLKRKSHTLYQRTLHSIEALDAMIAAAPPSADRAVAGALLEISLAYETYQDSPKSTEYIQRAARLQQLAIEETALIGVRTKWQSFMTAQLVVNAASSIDTQKDTAETENSFPTEVDGEAAGHDLFTRPRTNFSTAEVLADLSPLQCAILLAICGNIERNNPDHDLTRERIQAYVERILANAAQTSSTLAMALLVRSRIEVHRARVAQRSLLQIQQLLEDATVEKKICLTDDFYLLAFPSVHALRAEVGERYMEQNLFKTALEYFQELHEWRSVIACASRLEQRQSVADLAQRLLRSDPRNVQLLVALGMSTGDENILKEAWDISENGSAEAARALAEFYMRQDDFRSAMRFFDECLRLNPTFGADWFTLGYTAMRLSDWQRAAEAFTRVCQIDPDSAMGWNNLAACLIRAKRLRPAMHALSQALKFDRQSWQMWQNHFALAVELQELSTAVCSLENLVRFGGRKVEHDSESLKGLVDYVVGLLRQHGKIVANTDEMELHYDSLRQRVAAPEAPSAKHSPEFVERHAVRLETVLGSVCADHPFTEDLFVIAAHFAFRRGKFAEAEAFCLGEVRALKAGDMTSDAQRRKLLGAGARLLYIHGRRVDAEGSAGVRETLGGILELTRGALAETATWQALSDALEA